MLHLVEGVRHAITGKSHYAALGLALALPDIAGWVETPSPPGGRGNSQARYSRWFTANVQPTYTSRIGANREEHVFLNGDDCYALRCAYLHSGEFDTTDQRARKALDEFVFIVCPLGVSFHRNQSNRRLQLEVPTFCEDMARAVEKWIPTLTDADMLGRLAGLALIQTLDMSQGISF
jgi:hypothetical protein